MKIDVFAKLVGLGLTVWDKVTKKEPMTKRDIIVTSIIAVVVWLLFQFGGLTFDEINQAAETVQDVKETLGG